MNLVHTHIQATSSNTNEIGFRAVRIGNRGRWHRVVRGDGDRLQTVCGRLFRDCRVSHDGTIDCSLCIRMSK